jgi:hypothetical protein
MRFQTISLHTPFSAMVIFLLLFMTGCSLVQSTAAQPPTSATGSADRLQTTQAVEVASPTVLDLTVPTNEQPSTISSATPENTAETTVTAPSEASATTAAETPTLPSEKPPVLGPQLAFLRDGDIWLLDSPHSQPYQLTIAGDIMSFAWSPDGERLAAFNGRSLCIFHRDGSIRTGCLELGLSEMQAQIERRLVWSPDQHWIVLWNPVNPWDEDSIGWLIVALDTTNAMYRIQDPVDWGASLAPDNEIGGITGQPIFLSDNRLVGTLTHRYLCSSGGCHYHLFEFDLNQPGFTPYPNNPQEGWSEGQNLALSRDGRILTNYGAFFLSCESYITFVDDFDLSTQSRQTYNLEQQAVAGLAFSPDHQVGILARTAGCSSPDQAPWNQTCGLSQGFEVFSMQRWELASGEFSDLPAGIAPSWSSDGQWVAFQSCLVERNGSWEPDANAPSSIYIMDSSGAVMMVSSGAMPTWRP